MGADWQRFLQIASKVYHSQRKSYPNLIIFNRDADWPQFLRIASRVYRSQRKSYPKKELTYTNIAPVLIKELERQTYLEPINQQDKWNKLLDRYYSNSFTTKSSGPFIIPLLLGINNLPLSIEFQNLLTKMQKRVTETPGHESFKVEGYNNFVEKFSHALLNNMHGGSQDSFDGELWQLNPEAALKQLGLKKDSLVECFQKLPNNSQSESFLSIIQRLPLSAFILHDQLEEINQRHKNTVMGQLLWILAELVKNARTRTLRNDESWTELDKRCDGEQWNVRYKTTIGRYYFEDYSTDEVGRFEVSFYNLHKEQEIRTFVDISEYYRQYKAQGILNMMDSFNNSKPCS